MKDQVQELVVVTTTAGDRDLLETIAKSLVEDRLAACCQIGGPVTSVYRWQGKVETANEFVCSIKTRRSLLESVKKKICELHSYDVPQVIVTPIVDGLPGYLEWALTETES